MPQTIILDENNLETEDLDNPPASFIGNVERELRTLANVMLGYLKLWYDRALGPLVLEQTQALFAMLNRACELRIWVGPGSIPPPGDTHPVERQPRQANRFGAKLARPPVTEGGQLATPNAKARRILIVDDEEAIASTLQDGLKMLPGCEIMATTEGQQALQLFAQQPFDLLITDYLMPDLDGIMLSKHIRCLYPRTAIIMITAHGDNELYEQATTIPIQRILDKPVRLAKVRRVALEALAG